MKKKIRRFFEIIGGGFLILAGIVMLATPGSGILAIVTGIMLISPYHGRRILWWGKQLWRRIKSWWYSWRFKRVIKGKILRKARFFKRASDRFKNK